MKKLVIVGGGFVGGTCYQAFSKLNNWDVQVYDLHPEESYLTKNWIRPGEIRWAESIKAVSDADLVFCAVPTPMIEETGECHIGIVESVIKDVRVHNQSCWICIKSTVPPGTTQRLYSKYKGICFNPEFLTEKNAFLDFVELPYQIIGYPEFMPGLTDSLDCTIEQLYLDATEQNLLRGGEAIFSVTSTEAEMVKYMRNTYLATRLSFFNEMKQICDALEIDYIQTKYWTGLDARVGNHYNSVDPANRGFGGHCLPKDLGALIYLAKRVNVNPSVLEGARAKNLEVRDDRDWEQMENRAILRKNK